MDVGPLVTAVTARREGSTAREQATNGVLLCLLTGIAAELLLGVLGFTATVSRFNFFSAAQLAHSAGRILISFTALYIVHQFALVSLKNYKPVTKDLVTLHVILAGTVLLVSFGYFFSAALARYMTDVRSMGPLAPESLFYGIPFAAGALLVQAVLGLHRGLVFSLSLSVLIGIYTSYPAIAVYSLMSSLVACLSLTQFRTRQAYVKAGLNIAIALFPFTLASIVLTDQANVYDACIRLVGTFCNGMFSVFIFAGFTPIVEHVGGYVTDMRLIEMATLDNPILKNLSINAPGTWNHSMVMGMMVEAAADSVGANPVLARVSAYFHDIGKIKKPAYFVENQMGKNPHDALTPSMSALIIRSHVKDGIEMARAQGLPEAIVDMIPQHHGTSTIEYFYRKALIEAEEKGTAGDIDETLYKYPGPKPQTKEAGILLLADGIEAATRTLKEPTLDRIQGLVQKMINKVFASGELNECDLTLKDLHEIAKCFTRVLNGIYHQRISYFEPAEKVNERALQKATAANNKPQENVAAAKEEDVLPDLAPLAAKEASKPKEPTKKVVLEGEKKEDLKRLGL
jgi:cyclic-di-AMP phosphodiesterase PgpH